MASLNGEMSFLLRSKNTHRFPLLSLLAGRYLSTPPSSVESERVFSIGTQIYSPKRGGNLSGKTAQSLMFINYNLHFFYFKYKFDLSLSKKQKK